MTEHKFNFKGMAGEYFGIWIVNILLTLVTLGIYGAWAKVRDKKYFYNNTELNDHSFDYHATPKQILIGRIIVVAVIAFLSLLSAINPMLYIAGVVLLMVVMPFIIVRSLMFNARVSSYRNVRFDFSGPVKQAFLSFFVYPIANLFTAYMCTPLVTRSQQRFLSNNAKYGDRDFKFDKDIGDYYAAFFVSIGVAIGGGLVLLIIFAIITAIIAMLAGGAGFDFDAISAASLGLEDEENSAAMIALFVGIASYYMLILLSFFVSIIVYKTWTRNLLLSNTVLDDQHHLESKIHIGRYLLIVLTNTLLAIITLGLMIPWGRIRLMKYVSSVTSLKTEGSLEGYSSNVQKTGGVISAEYMDIDGIDVGLGL